MDKPLSRIHRDRIGWLFHPVTGEQRHTEVCQAAPANQFHLRSSWHMQIGCLIDGEPPPIILHAVWINDLCRRDPILPIFLHYADDRVYTDDGHVGNMLFAKERRDKPGHLGGDYPYTRVEISYEITHGRRIVRHVRPRFRLSELEQLYSIEFMEAAEELCLTPERLFEIVRFHADPRVEMPLLLDAA